MDKSTLTIQDVLVEMRNLTRALNTASKVPSSSCCTKHELRHPKVPGKPFWLDPQRYPEIRDMYKFEHEKLHKVDEKKSFERGKKLLEELINLDFKDRRLAARVKIHPDPIFHFRLSGKGSGGPPYKCVEISKKNETLSSEDRKRAIENWKGMDRGMAEWQQLKKQKEWIPKAAQHIKLTRQWKRPFGNIYWMIDDETRTGYPARGEGVGHDHPDGCSKTMEFAEIILLAGYFSISDAQTDLERSAFQQFILSFSNPFHPLARRSWRKLLRACDSNKDPRQMIAYQYHLSYFAPTSPQSPTREIEGLVLERLSATIWPIAHDSSPSDHGISTKKQHFAERVLSISLMVYGKPGTFQIVALGDRGDRLEIPGAIARGEKLLGIKPGSSATTPAACLTYFLITLRALLYTWNRGWEDTLDAINNTVINNMNHAVSGKQLERYMFDNSSSMELSKQYFAVLRLLGIARQRIDENLAEWEKFCGTMEGTEGTLECWVMQREKVTQFLKTETEQLRDRIDRMTTEVESLRDGLFNATNLKEAAKAMALNRAIYVFTAVTIAYTPAGFMAAIWALPILNTNDKGENIQASTHAVWISFIAVPILTYAVCGLFVWRVTSTKTYQSLRSKIRNLKPALRGRIGPPGRLWYKAVVAHSGEIPLRDLEGQNQPRQN